MLWDYGVSITFSNFYVLNWVFCFWICVFFFLFLFQFKGFWDFVVSIAFSNFSFILWDFVVLIVFLIFHLCCEILHQHIVNACVQLCKIYINSKRKLIILLEEMINICKAVYHRLNADWKFWTIWVHSSPTSPSPVLSCKKYSIAKSIDHEFSGVN